MRPDAGVRDFAGIRYSTRTARQLHPVRRAVAIWIVSVITAAGVVASLQSKFGSVFEYPEPRALAPAGISFLSISLMVTVWLAMSERRRRHCVPWIIISISAGICFYPFLLCSRSFVTTNFLSATWAYPYSQVNPPAKTVNPEPHDSFMMYFPFKYFLTETLLKRHTFPFWDPFRNCGMPFLAATLSGALYPLNFVFLIFGTEPGWGVVGLIHLLVAGMGTWLLAHALTRSRIGGLYAALSFMLLPYLAGWSRGIVWNSTGVWIPLIGYLFLGAAKGNVRKAALAPVVIATATFGGWIQWAIYIYLLLGICAAMYCVVEYRRSGPKKALRTQIILGSVLICSLLISLPHLGPVGEVSSHQARSPVPWSTINRIRLPYGESANLAYLIPELFGNHVDLPLATGWSFLEFQRYMGFLAVPLAVLSFLGSCRMRKLALFLFIPFVFFLSVSRIGICYRFLYYLVPGFSAIPYQQTRSIFFVQLLMILLAAIGASNLRRLARSNSSFLTAYFFGWAAIYIILSVVMTNDLLKLQLAAESFGSGARRCIAISLILVAAAVFVSAIGRRFRTVNIFGLISIVVIAAELGTLHQKIASFCRPLPDKTPPIIREINSASPHRILRAGGLRVTYAFIQNSAALIDGVYDTMDFDSIYLLNYTKLYALLNESNNFHAPHDLRGPREVTSDNIGLIKLLGTEYIFFKELETGTRRDPSSFDASLVEYVREEEGRSVLKVKDPLPRAFFVQRVEEASENRMTKVIPTAAFDPAKVAYVSRPAPEGGKIS